jgi:RNA polymerase sigma-70 factor (ECF subfamily)
MRLQMTVAETGPCVQAMEAGRSPQSNVKESGIMSSIGPDTHGVDFNTVYSDFYPRILRYLARLVGPDEAEDVSQEVFIKISRSLVDYRGEGISSWVYRTATNAAMDRRRRASPIAIPTEEESMAPDSAETAEQHLIRGEMSDCVRGLIDALPDTYRAVLILSEIEGLADARDSECRRSDARNGQDQAAPRPAPASRGARRPLQPVSRRRRPAAMRPESAGGGLKP